jgi:hypothetical protein
MAVQQDFRHTGPPDFAPISGYDMSRVRQTKISTPSNPPTNTEELDYASAGAGFNSPAELQSVDESGNIAVLA